MTTQGIDIKSRIQPKDPGELYPEFIFDMIMHKNQTLSLNSCVHAVNTFFQLVEGDRTNLVT